MACFFNHDEEKGQAMSREQLYQWQARIGEVFGALGFWQVLGLALYSYGVILARQCAPSRVAEKLVGVGKADSVQRRLERWLHNPRVDWQACCRVWAGWVVRQYAGERVILLVDETKLGDKLSAMVVGLAYRGCCIPLAFWCYPPKQWPMGQVALIGELLSWIGPSLPTGCIPIVQADRGIGTSPDLLRLIEGMGWHYLVRVQKNTRLRQDNGPHCPLARLVEQAGQTWHGQGQVFKKAGWLDCTVHILWGPAYREAWCLVTNCPDLDGWLYGLRYWQEASFRDLKSDGWQWQTSRIWTPAHANRLLLVLALAYAWVLTLGTLALDDTTLTPLVAKGRTPTYSLFRLGLRLWEAYSGLIHDPLMAWASDYLCFISPPHPKSVGA